MERGQTCMNDLRATRYNAKTHVGLKRKVNEDAILALP
ncbi:MAG: serine/threonine-protein phosphatase Stp1, partial [Paracoccaceae bacterium]